MTPDDAKKLWEPSDEFVKNSNLTHYKDWIAEKKGVNTKNYSELWKWSVENIDRFWESLLEYFRVSYNGKYYRVFSGKMPRVQWFEGTELSYAEHVFRNKNSSHPAIVYASENESPKEISWEQLEQYTGAMANWLLKKGVQKGDRVAAYIHNGPEAIISFLATNSIGAIWTSTSPDFGISSVFDRFNQIEPKILICSQKYFYGGKTFDKSSVISQLLEKLPSVENVVLVNSDKGDGEKIDSEIPLFSWVGIMNKKHELTFTRVPFNHPIWVLYSSGTTGLPKPITHSQGGILMEHLKYLTFHNNIKKGDRCFWYTTTGWMMWNYIQASLLVGGTVVLYDGSPAYPDIDVLWKLAEDVGINHFGTSAGFVIANIKAENRPGEKLDLSKLISVGSTGSPLPPEGFDWLYNAVKKDLWVASISGGTDVCSAFVGGNPHWPVYSGEIQCRALGCALEAFDPQGNSVKNEVGEMVITKPMPSMPVFFWGDNDFKRYRSSYFEMYRDVWRHGVWTEITGREGIVIYGRSDSTLNRGGVRIGTSEIYRAVDSVNEIKDSIIVCLENDSGDYYMPLFVVLKEDKKLDDQLKSKLKSTIREFCSPRHVPDEFIAIDEVPYTISGKKVETPVKKILLGDDPAKVLNKDALRNPGSLDFFKGFRSNMEKFLNK